MSKTIRTHSLLTSGIAFVFAAALMSATLASAQSTDKSERDRRETESRNRADSRADHARSAELRREIASPTRGDFGAATQMNRIQPADVGGFSGNGFISPSGTVQSAPSTPRPGTGGF